MASVTFFVPGFPGPSGSKRPFPIYKGKGNAKVFTGRVALVDAGGQRTKDWRASVVHGAFQAMKDAQLAPFEGPVKMELKFVMPRPKYHYRSNGQIKDTSPDWHTIAPDAKKLGRSTTDAMKGICFRDDSQVCDDRATKKYGDITGCEITISELTT